jgi:hypothetical protein
VAEVTEYRVACSRSRGYGPEHFKADDLAEARRKADAHARNSKTVCIQARQVTPWVDLDEQAAKGKGGGQ